VIKIGRFGYNFLLLQRPSFSVKIRVIFVGDLWIYILTDKVEVIQG